MDRLNLGVVHNIWPRLSVPCPVKDFFWRKAKRLPPEIHVSKKGMGYHNAGWSYIEVEIQAPLYSRAVEIADDLGREVFNEAPVPFQHRYHNG